MAGRASDVQMGMTKVGLLLIRMEWRPAGWLNSLPPVIFLCTIQVQKKIFLETAVKRVSVCLSDYHI